MKSKKEIERLGWDYTFEKFGEVDDFYDTNQGFQDGYTQCKEDIFNELNEWIVITLSAESKLGSPNSVIETLLSVKYKIESLNKQD